jgi:tight adherence protein B
VVDVTPPLYKLSILLAAGFGLLSLVSVLRDLLTRDRTRLRERIADQLSDRQRKRAKDNLLRQLSSSEMQRILNQEKSPWYRLESLQSLLEQAGLSLAPTTILLWSLGGFLVGAVPTALWFPPLWHALVAGALCATLPFAVLLRLRNRREDQLRHQLGDVFDLMSTTLRAGQSITESMRAVSKDFSPPVSEEFFLCSEQQNLGLDPELALRQLAARNRIPELKTFVVALLVQRSSGGNLSDVLQTLSRMVRERLRMIGEIDSLTAEARLQAYILMALPPFLLAAMTVLNPEYAQGLFDMPELLQLMIAGMAVGWLWIRRIIRFDG